MKNLDFAHLSSSDITYIDSLYQQFRDDGESVDQSWRRFFEGVEFANGIDLGASGGVDTTKLKKEFNVFRLIQSYRARGHLLSDTNPIRPRRDRDARIDLVNYDLSENDLEESFACGEFCGLPGGKLKDIIFRMRSLYCGKIGVEYMHCNNTDVRRWMREKFESRNYETNFAPEKKKQILHKLNEANVFESFLQTKYTGQKRFSLEGGETTIPALDAIIRKGSELGAKEFVIAMAHRGRLNVLANIIGKTYEYIFSEFDGQSIEQLEGQGDGDVKYHMGFTSVKDVNGKEIYLKLLPNPSHLETVAAVSNGYCRALIDIEYKDEAKVVPITIHGDAAVAGQGIVYELLQMSELEGYRAGGTIHFVINNQIGFTTDFVDARSSHYSTSVAKTLDIPIFHVNGDNPEAVVLVCEWAMEFRQKFKKDVFVDMVCYRKHGHNEGDEPKYTQPHLYGLISKVKNPRELYLDRLLSTSEVNEEIANEMMEKYQTMLSDRFNNVKQMEMPKKVKGPHQEWKNLRWSRPEDFERSPETAVSLEMLTKALAGISSVPSDFKPLRKAKKILDERKKKFANNSIDWPLAELFAYGTLLMEGINIRFSGQDVIRGTFSHRHAKVFDERTNTSYCGLDHIQENQGRVSIYNSLLSEYAVLGFEYGYSQASPGSLNIWEAQFGDFSNGAQILIDQFISAGESKWRRMSDLVLLLPHGYEGAGPEHSSCRPERYLQLCAEFNMVVCNFTTPANFFHGLRRQNYWEFRKPLIIFSPKSLLRSEDCVSSIEELTTGAVREIIDDVDANPEDVKILLVCSGKIYFDLLKHKVSEGRKDVAIVRLEQLYPIAEKQMLAILEKYKNAQQRWVQEEPLNMGAWTFLLRFPHLFGKFSCISRKSSASPATGYASVHLREQKELVDKAFA